MSTIKAANCRGVWRKSKVVFLSTVLIAGVPACGPVTGPAEEPVPENQAEVTVDAQTVQAMEEFDRRKFGMFIHWGLYAVAAGEWQGEYVPGIGEWIQFRKRIPNSEYERLADQFNPTLFDADEWAQLAKDAGMKYMVITSKHHDGFAMYDSDVSDYDIVERTPWKRDPMASLSQAARDRDIQFGFYYSQDQDWHERHARGNTWDFPAERDPQLYLQAKSIPQVKEIVSNYGDLGLIWFDTPGSLSKEQAASLRNIVKEKQPQALLNSRIGHGLGDYFQTGDNAIPLQPSTTDGKFEVAATINDTWGYKKDDENWKSTRDLISKLFDIVSKGGNYLLNVGPKPDGTIPEGSVARLREIGDWLKVYGDAIYGTDPCPFFYHGVEWRCTVKDNKLHLFFVHWPDDPLVIEGLVSDVDSVVNMRTTEAIAFNQSGERLELELPEAPPNPYEIVLEVSVGDDVVEVSPTHASDARPKTVNLHAWAARLKGEAIRYDWETRSVSNFPAVTREHDQSYLIWYPYGSLGGEYSVSVTYASDNSDNTGAVLFANATFWNSEPYSRLGMDLPNTNGEFVEIDVPGTITVRSDESVVALKKADFTSDSEFTIQKIVLNRVNTLGQP